MIQLSELYQQGIDRYLEGVIKADDLSHVAQEVEEYVLTEEITRKLSDFFEAYNRKAGNNGVWIAGFFGSGKSHLLKMLSYLLENRLLDQERKVGDVFLPKVKGNALLKAEIQKALRHPAKSILFNIDQKTDDSTKQATNPILSVFVKVFDEMQGYYGRQGYIANFERDLDQNGQLQVFRQAFSELAGKPWEQGREEVLLQSHLVGRAIHQVQGIPLEQANELIFRYEEQYQVSPESFAERVAAWLDTQGPEARINFLVDEIGQYISNQTKLMLNLQTIAETLATKCQGRAWVIVTSQQDIDSVVGGLNSQQNNDFSRIQDRFAVKLNLTSKNADEVIMKRLFAKKEQHVPALEELYQKEHNNIQTLVQIEGRTFRGYRDVEHFVQAYPVMPYQFTLLKMANENLASHHAFLGRHRSVGERSLMDVFKLCGVKTMQQPLRRFIPFDLAFEGLRPTLKSSMQSSINIAEDNLGDDFAVRVLKALFLVKYVKEFKATARNIAVLLLDDLDVDLNAHNQQVQAALNRLEYETYIQRNGEEYSFLTSEEKDIEAEIKNLDLNPQQLNDFLRELVFDEVLQDKKIRYRENKEDYAFSRMLDGQTQGREQELSLHVITPLNERYSYRDALVADTMGRAQLLFILPEDQRLLGDAELHLKTKRYIQHHRSTQDDATRQTILAAKATLNNQRLQELTQRLSDLLSRADAYVAGQAIDLTPHTQARARIHQAFQQLIAQSYPNLRMVKQTYTEQDTTNYLIQPAENDLFGGSLDLTEAEQEVLSHVQRSRNQGQRSTFKGLIDHFERKPYGWRTNAIQAVVARLFRRSKVEIRFEGQEQTGPQVNERLNARNFDRLQIEPIANIDRRQLQRLQEIHRELFYQTNAQSDPKAAALDTRKEMGELGQKLEKLLAQQREFPFVSALSPVLEAAQKVKRMEWSQLYEEWLADEDQWLDWKEDLIEPIQSFVQGPQGEIYQDIRLFLNRGEANLPYLDPTSVEQLRNFLEAEAPYRGNQTQQAKRALDTLKQELQDKIQQTREQALAEMDLLIDRLQQAPEYSQLPDMPARRLLGKLTELRQEIEKSAHIPVIKERLTYAQGDLYSRLTAEMVSLATPAGPPAPASTPSNRTPSTGETTATPTPRYQVYRKDHIKLNYPQTRIKTSTDLDAYLHALRQKYQSILDQGDQIEV